MDFLATIKKAIAAGLGAIATGAGAFGYVLPWFNVETQTILAGLIATGLVWLLRNKEGA